ncbi:MAG: Arm DNA-binding domain-containing protein, partial [Sphingobium sp.]
MNDDLLHIIESARSKACDYSLNVNQHVYLLVTRKGRKFWRLRYSLQGRQRVLPLGEWPVVSVDAARERGLQALALLGEQRGRPSTMPLRKEVAACDISFERIAAEWLERMIQEGIGKAALYKHRWLINKALPWLSGKPVASILPADIFSVLKSEEAAGRFETAKRLRSTLSRIFTYAVLTERAEKDPSANLR